MDNKYLPIGTVCTLKDSNKKIMIISYFSIEYNGNVTMYDYKGCVYPEGLLLPSQTISFNHNQIINVDFVGFKNEQYEVFNNALNRNQEEPDKDYDRKSFMSNLKFDENGVVVFDGTTSFEENIVKDKTVDTVNPFKNEYSTESNNEQSKSNIFKFDENGFVISDGTETIDSSINTPKYQFDENGFVISDGTDTTDNTPELQVTGDYKFDENGTVIDDITEVISDTSVPNTTNNYQFDENGVVIGAGTGTTNNIEPQVTGGYKFDENGMVISE